MYRLVTLPSALHRLPPYGNRVSHRRLHTAALLPLLTWVERAACLTLVLGALSAPAQAQTRAETSASLSAGQHQALPEAMLSALARAQIPSDAVGLWVQEVGSPVPLMQWRPEAPMNPASLMKLFTTLAALDLLGPAWAWSTPVWLQGDLIASGVLKGQVHIQGRGDPKLVHERIWLLLKRLQQAGVLDIQGDIVLDRTAFEPDESDPGAFDGEPLRPYNVRADALLLNHKSLSLVFTPDPSRGRARVSVEPALADLSWPPSVPLSAKPCEDWRGGLQAQLGDPQQLRLGGAYPIACGERSWPLAFADAKGFNARLLKAMWQEMGGRLRGQVRDGPAPEGPPLFTLSSPPLAEVVRDINKFSNNVMAQQLFLTLALQQRGHGSPEMAKEVLHSWSLQRLGAVAQGLQVDNGSGLSRENRVSAQMLGALLQRAWNSPVMPEFMSSLPVSGVDGTLKRFSAAAGQAHLKTGSLRDVWGLAGYLLDAKGRRLVVVALINHPQAHRGREAMDTLLRWASERP